MKKIWRLLALLLLVALVATGCGTPENDPEEEATPTPSPSPSPTPFVVTPEPTVTPIVFEGEVEYPESGATLLMIDPVDKPTAPPVELGEYRTESLPELGISFEIPAYWEKLAAAEGIENTVAYAEPMDQIRSGTGVPSSVTVSVSSYSTQQTLQDAEAALDDYLTQLRAEFPDLQNSRKDSNQMLGEEGSYVTYWLEIYPADSEYPVYMRGRILVLPKERRLYMVRYMCPRDFNGSYESVYKKIRSSFTEI